MDASKILGGFFKGGVVPEDARAKVNQYAYEISKIKAHLAELSKQKLGLESDIGSLSKLKSEKTLFLEKEAESNAMIAKVTLSEANEKKELALRVLAKLNDDKDVLDMQRKVFLSEQAPRMTEIYRREDECTTKENELKRRELLLDEGEKFLKQQMNEHVKNKQSVDLLQSSLMRRDAELGSKEADLMSLSSELKAKERNIIAKFDEITSINAQLDGKEVDLRLREQKLADELASIDAKKNELTQAILIHKANSNDLKRRMELLKNNEDRLQAEVAKVEDMKRAILQGEAK